MRSGKHHIILLTLVGALVGGADVHGQHAEHQTPKPTNPTEQVGEQAVSGCSESAQSAVEDLDALAARLEQARQTNSAADMRNAVDDIHAALDRLRAQVRPCAQETPSAKKTMDHARHGPSVAVDLCAIEVDHRSAPHVMHEGKTYYFCSESDRQRFLADPAKFVKTLERQDGS
ncbi:MAG: YHS domain-containing protein [Luteitalea sp.]|nr:YHS domain-containing protein [Luteitalea sp.]